MQELDDIALLREFTEHDSEPAFAALVTRHIDRVYSVALRHTRNPYHAEEITQAVFVILARKSKHLGKNVILEGWLYQTARLTALTFIRSEIRRARREQEAYMQTVLNENESKVWAQIAPELDAALAGLNQTDRNAVVLRFFYSKSMDEIGMALGANADTARMRIHRAIGKLQKFFSKRGVNSTSEAITGAISANSIQIAPAILAKAVTATAIAKGATVSTSTLTLIKGALKIMAWTKAKTAIVAGAVVLFAAGATTFTITKAEKHNAYQWQIETNDISKILWKAPPMVEIRPAKFSKTREDVIGSADGNKQRLGFSISLHDMILDAYDAQPTRVIFPKKLPREKYDFITSLPKGAAEALAQEIKRKFGYVGKWKTVETNAFVLKFSDSKPNNLQPAFSLMNRMNITNASSTELALGFDRGDAHFNRTMRDLIWQNSLEDSLQTPVIDETGFTNRFDYVFHYPNPDSSWRRNENAPKQALKDALYQQLGLELVLEKRPIQMLVVEKAN